MALARNNVRCPSTLTNPPLDAPVAVSLSCDEALVLFEFLSRYEQDERLSIEDRAEDYVLTKLLGDLERGLVAPFDPRYADLLAGARARVRESHGESDAPAS
jgi:hypothetical protein